MTTAAPTTAFALAPGAVRVMLDEVPTIEATVPEPRATPPLSFKVRASALPAQAAAMPVTLTPVVW